MLSFYEAIDEIFENTNASSSDWLEIKSKIIMAYQNSTNRNAKHISNMIKPKMFHVCNDGSITRIK